MAEKPCPGVTAPVTAAWSDVHGYWSLVVTRCSPAAVPAGGRYGVVAPHCGGEHYHGGGDDFAAGPYLGDRGSHCGAANYTLVMEPAR